jgi:predicted TIM-barrel fold metal-dependent hydrolase
MAQWRWFRRCATLSARTPYLDVRPMRAQVFVMIRTTLASAMTDRPVPAHWSLLSRVTPLRLVACSTLLLAACSTVRPAAQNDSVPAPRVAAHQHLISPAFTKIIDQPELNGADLLRLLDAAGIQRGVVLSMGYSFGDERKKAKVADFDRATTVENDWTSQQVVSSQGRLIGFCSVNPLRDAALSEIARCLALPGMVGLKLHFGNSGVSLRDSASARRMEQVFAFANAQRAAIVVHLRSRTGTPYGREDAQLFLDRLLPRAPDVVVQVAHLAGTAGFPDYAEQAMDVFASAIERKDPRTRNLYFDQTAVATAETTAEEGARIARMIRRVRAQRVFFGSDMPVSGNPPPAESWAIFRAKVPLTVAELRTIALNEPSYVTRRESR